jgi:uncharacterized membrane protein
MSASGSEADQSALGQNRHDGFVIRQHISRSDPACSPLVASAIQPTGTPSHSSAPGWIGCGELKVTTANSIGPLESAHSIRTGTARPCNSDGALRGAAAFWLLVALAGQWAFLDYIAAFYGASTLTGSFEVWNRLAALGRSPYVVGDTIGNLTFAAHALAAGVVAFGGALQLIPQVRQRLPVFHRWNGRVFLVTVVALSLSGFYLVWVRRASLSPVSTTLNGLLILTFAFLAWRAVRARRIAVHRRWAMRLYLVSNAQWFLRVGVFSYFAINQAIGNPVSFGDPFLRFWTFGCYLVPLAVLEMYLRARDGSSPIGKGAVAGSLVVLTLIMGVGIFAFGMFSQLIVSGAPLQFPR